MKMCEKVTMVNSSWEEVAGLDLLVLFLENERLAVGIYRDDTNQRSVSKEKESPRDLAGSELYKSYTISLSGGEAISEQAKKDAISKIVAHIQEEKEPLHFRIVKRIEKMLPDLFYHSLESDFATLTFKHSCAGEEHTGESCFDIFFHHDGNIVVEPLVGITNIGSYHPEVALKEMTKTCLSIAGKIIQHASNDF